MRLFCEKFGKEGNYLCEFDLLDKSFTSVHEDVKAFIRSLLTLQRKQMREMVEGMKKKIDNHPSEECGYNLAISDVLSVLDKE